MLDGQTALAGEANIQALAADPDYIVARVHLASLLLEAGDLPGAIKQYQANIGAPCDTEISS